MSTQLKQDYTTAYHTSDSAYVNAPEHRQFTEDDTSAIRLKP